MPPFGHPMLTHWPLDPDITYLNHGTVGATPRPVLEAQQRLRDEMERQPSRFMLREYLPQAGNPLPQRPRIRAAADQIAEFLGAAGDDLVFVDNATTGINAILSSLTFKPDEEIVLLDVAYGAIANAANYYASKHGAVVSTLDLPFPLESPEQVVATIEAGLTSRTRLAIIDHITSESALLLPIHEISALCRTKGVPLLVDGAHAPGAIPLNIPEIGADWYVGNLHKWAWAPRSCGILWAARERQTGLHSAVISWGINREFTWEFDWIGTKDPTPALASPAGIAFMRSLGVSKVQSYNHDLAWQGARMLCERFGTKLTVPESMIGTMATWPLPRKFGSTKTDSCNLRDRILFEDRIEAQIHPFKGQLWMRISAQIYNEMSDLERFADALSRQLGA